MDFICIMFNKCSVFGCFTNFQGHDAGTVFGLPNNEDLKSRWLKFINRSDLDPTSSFIFVCEKHFENKYFNKNNPQRIRLIKKLNPVPTIYPEKISAITPSLLPNISQPRKPPTQRIYQPDEINSDSYKKLQINDFSSVNAYLLKYLSDDCCCSMYDDHVCIVFFKMVKNDRSIPEVTECIRVDHELHVQLFYKGSPLPLPSWFREGRNCKPDEHNSI